MYMVQILLYILDYTLQPSISSPILVQFQPELVLQIRLIEIYSIAYSSIILSLIFMEIRVQAHVYNAQVNMPSLALGSPAGSPSPSRVQSLGPDQPAGYRFEAMCTRSGVLAGFGSGSPVGPPRARLGMFTYALYTQACTRISMNIRDKIINEQAIEQSSMRRI